MCGVDIEVPLKKAHLDLTGAAGILPTHVIELRTLTPTEVTSGLTAKSTLVGPWLLKPAKMSLLPAVMNSWNVASADAVGCSGCSQRCAFVLSDHDCRYVVIEAGRPGHCDGISSDVVDDENSDGTCRFGIRDLLAEDACPAVNDCQLAGSARIDAGATVGLSIEQIK